MLGTGYLKVTGVVDLSEGIYKLKLPNQEIKHLFNGIIRDWFNDKVIGENLETILKDLISLNLRDFERKFKLLTLEMSPCLQLFIIKAFSNYCNIYFRNDKYEEINSMKKEVK